MMGKTYNVMSVTERMLTVSFGDLVGEFPEEWAEAQARGLSEQDFVEESFTIIDTGVEAVPPFTLQQYEETVNVTRRA